MSKTQIPEMYRFLLLRSKRISLLQILVLAVICAFGVRSLLNLKTEYTMKQFLPKTHPLLEADLKVRGRFQLEEREPFFALITLPEGTWFDVERIRQLRSITEEMGTEEGVQSALSLATIEGASSAKTGLSIGNLLEQTAPDLWANRILKDPILTPQLISPDAKTVVLAVSTLEISAKRAEELQAITRAKLKAKFPGYDVKMGGVPVFQSEMNSILTRELKNFLLLSVLASLFTLVFFFRSLSSIIVPLILLVASNIMSLAWMAWAGISFTVLTTTLPVLVAITVVSMAAHTMLRYSSDWELAKRSQENPNPLIVLLRSYRGLLMPNFLTAVTTSVGFLAIAFTDIPLIRQYGLTVGVSIFICWFVVIVTLLPLLVLFPLPKVRHWTESRARWALIVTNYRKEVLFGTSIVAAAFLWQGRELNWSARLFDDLPKNHEARTTTEFVDQSLGGMVPFFLVMEKNEENYWNDPKALSVLSSLAQSWRKDPRVGSVVGPQDFLSVAGSVQGKGMPVTRQEAAEYNFLYAFSEKNPLKQFLSPDGKAARVNIRFHDIPGDQMELAMGQFIREAQLQYPDWTITSGGMATTVHRLNNELSRELIYGFWQALLVIGVVLLLAFRSLRWTLVSMLPNLLPPMILLGALNLGGVSVKPGIALIFSIALGISFDNTVYLLGRLKLNRDRSPTRRVSVVKAWYQEGNLCLFSSLALSAGFLVFLTSFFALNQQFGIYMLISVVGGLVGDLFFLPALVAAFPRLIEPLTIDMKEKSMRKNVAAGLVLAVMITPAVSLAAPMDPNNAKALLDQVQKNVNSNDEVASLKMTITEADGSQKDRGLEIRRKGKEDKQKVLVRMQLPADLKGTALLSVNKGKESDQWLYLPSSKQTRRILSSKRNSSFMDSELSFEDMGASSDAQFSNKVLRQETWNGRKYSVIESMPKGDCSYGKIHIWVDLGTYLVGKMEYFDKGQKPLKTSVFTAYKQFDKGVWRAQKIQVANLQTKRGTVLELSDLKINKNLDDGEFTESALTDD